MASDITPYLGNKILRWLGGNAMPTAPAALFLALYDGDPRGAGVEVTENIRYEGRLAIDLAVPADDGDTVQMLSDGIVDFGAAESETDISHVAVFDAAAGGNMLWAKALSGGPFTAVVDANVSFGAADLAFNVGE